MRENSIAEITDRILDPALAVINYLLTPLSLEEIKEIEVSVHAATLFCRWNDRKSFGVVAKFSENLFYLMHYQDVTRKTILHTLLNEKLPENADNRGDA